MPTLEFKGKQAVYAHHLTVLPRQLVADSAKSVVSDCAIDTINISGGGDDSPIAPVPDNNLIIHGDNLHALKALLPRFAGRVKCVYIDPPYNTGNQGWIYNDNVSHPHLKAWLNQVVDRDDLERHDKWLCLMWPRLQLLRELLADDGVIFVSIDDHEQHRLRLLMDEIFGEKNFFAVLTRKAMHTVRNSSKDFNLNADYVLVYAKEKAWFGEHNSRYIRHIVDKSGNYPHEDGDGRGKYKLDPIHARNYYEPYTFTFTNGNEWSPPAGRYPGYSVETLRQMEKENRIVFSGKDPRAKRYLSEVQEGQPPDVVLRPEFVGFNADGTRELRDIFGQGGVFPQPKPIKLIKFLLEVLRSEDAIVLDAFAGSGTTAHAVLALNKEDGGNRKFILIESEDYADGITAERVRRVIRGVPGAREKTLQEGLGGSFTYYTLGEPIEAEGMLTGDSLPEYTALAARLLHTASGIAVNGTVLTAQDSEGLFYRNGQTDYYLLYEPSLEFLESGRAVLTEERASAIAQRNCSKDEDRKTVVFAAVEYLGQRKLSEYGIQFRQLPYELAHSA